METGLALWDAAAAEAAKEAGIAQAGENKKQLLEYARGIAKELGRSGRAISADDVQRELERREISVHALGNSAGGLFEKKYWQVVGYTKSIREHSHGNLLRVWRLKNES